MTIFVTLALMAVGIINIIVGFVVFRRTAPGPVRNSFLALLIATGVWSISIGFFLVASPISRAQLFVNIYYQAAMYIGSGLLAFAVYVTHFKAKLTTFFSYLPSVILSGILFFDSTWIVKVINVDGNLSSRVDIHGFAYGLYSIVFFSLFGTGSYLMYRASQNLRGKERRRQNAVITGIATAGSAGVIFNLLLPALGQYDFIMIGPLLSCLFTASVTYAIVKYSLFDLRRTILSSISYIVASTTAAIVYISILWVIGKFFAESTGSVEITGAVYLSLALLVAVTFNALREFFDKITWKLFLREKHSAEAVLDTFGDTILDDVEATSIINKTIAVIESVIHPTMIGFLLTQGSDASRLTIIPEQNSQMVLANEQYLRECTEQNQVTLIDTFRGQNKSASKLASNGVAIIARMQVKDRIVGYIIVGEKRSGETYSASELHMITTMNDELALAIMNALRFVEIQQFNDRLKHEIDNATKELRATNKKLLELDATKDEFVSMASHQLRTPLTSVKGYISMVLEGDAGPVSKPQEQLLGEAFASSERMVHLISDFLNVSRLQTGKFMVDRRECDLAKIVTQEVEGIRQIASSHQIDIVYHQPTRFPTLYLDEGKIRQVIMNFIDNAIYYSPSGSKIRTNLHIEDGYALFEVHDSGIGVPKSEQEHLFTKFFRADNARKQRPDGTGIGLYLAKKIIDSHGGKIIFESVQDHGSTFGFRLPIKKLSLAPVENSPEFVNDQANSKNNT